MDVICMCVSDDKVRAGEGREREPRNNALA